MCEEIPLLQSEDAPSTRPGDAPRESVTIRLPAAAAARLRGDAKSRGWTISDVVEDALVGKAPRYAVSAAVAAQPLAAVGYRLLQMLSALDRKEPDVAEALHELRKSRSIVADALKNLHAEYDAELDTQDAERRDRWDG